VISIPQKSNNELHKSLSEIIEDPGPSCREQSFEVQKKERAIRDSLERLKETQEHI